MIQGTWAATTGTVSVGILQRGPTAGVLFTEATLTCDAAGAGLWTTPTLFGFLNSVEELQAGMTSAQAVTIKSQNGATLMTFNAATSAGCARHLTTDGAGFAYDAPVGEPLTVSIATNIGNASKAVTLRIYIRTNHYR